MKDMQSSHSLLRHNARAHDGVADVYDSKHAEIYNSEEQARLERTIDELLHLTGSTCPTVLDFGAGTGNLTLKFLAKGCRVTAADVSDRSLAMLERKAARLEALSTTLLSGHDIPYPEETFDVVACYSVLHHVPDYLHAVREMARVLRRGGLLYIDHEANDMAWTDDVQLSAYRARTRLSLPDHLLMLLRTGELFTYAFAKTAFMKAFVDRRYEREGDLHVWPDDHIEWDKVVAAAAHFDVSIVKTCDYLLYQPRGGRELYSRYCDVCTDTRYIFARKCSPRESQT